MSFEFSIGETTVYDTIVWVENTLVKSGKFSLLGKKALLEEADSGYQGIFKLHKNSKTPNKKLKVVN